MLKLKKKKMHKTNVEQSIRSDTKYFWFSVVKLINANKKV